MTLNKVLVILELEQVETQYAEPTKHHKFEAHIVQSPIWIYLYHLYETSCLCDYVHLVYLNKYCRY